MVAIETNDSSLESSATFYCDETMECRYSYYKNTEDFAEIFPGIFNLDFFKAKVSKQTETSS